MVIKNAQGRLGTCATAVHKCEKMKAVCCIKTREREKGGEREKKADLQLGKKNQLPGRATSPWSQPGLPAPGSP